MRKLERKERKRRQRDLQVVDSDLLHRLDSEDNLYRASRFSAAMPVARRHLEDGLKNRCKWTYTSLLGVTGIETCRPRNYA